MLTHFPPPEPDRMPPLSLAVRVGGLLFVSGAGPFEPGWRIAQDDFPAQMRAVLADLDRTLAMAGTDRRRIVKTNVLLVREQDIAPMNQLYAAWFGPPPYPARTTAVVKALPVPEFLLEIECVAAVGDD